MQIAGDAERSVLNERGNVARRTRTLSRPLVRRLSLPMHARKALKAPNSPAECLVFPLH